MVNYFESEINKELRRLSNLHTSFYTHRLLDTSTMRYALNNPNIFNIKQPCDVVVLYNGNSYFIELKSSRSPTSYAFQYIRPHQVSSLIDIENTDTKPHRTIYSHFFFNKRQRGKPLKCYALRANDVANLIASGKKSIKWNDLAKQAIEIQRIKGTWDLMPFFNTLE